MGGRPPIVGRSGRRCCFFGGAFAGLSLSPDADLAQSVIVCTMSAFIGIDGFRWGWVAAWIDKRGNQGFDYSPDLERLLGLPHVRAMIDMPIGLPTCGVRTCDQNARKCLGTSVFTGVRRDFWLFESQARANESYRATGQPGISAQLWSIRDKIRQVDAAMTPQRQRTLCETHPELAFRRLSKEVTLEGKHSAVGRNQRIALVRDAGFTAIDRWLGRRHGTGMGRDDLLDACVCALVARDSSEWIPAVRPSSTPRASAWRCGFEPATGPST
jgi:predicted RNase H-like nuclease